MHKPIETAEYTLKGDQKIFLATLDCWRAIYYPGGGGSQAFVWLDGIGWVVDVHDEMPHDVWLALLRAVGAPLAAH